MVRVLLGKARPDHEWSGTPPQSKMTTIRFEDQEESSSQGNQGCGSDKTGLEAGSDNNTWEMTRSQNDTV